MTPLRKRQQFRAILDSETCIVPASVFDPISVRIAEDIGFELAMFAGSTASLTVLGAPDIVLITLTELCEQVRRICRASDLPLMVDADHGYGNANNAVRTVKELDAAGAAALTIEDTDLPPRLDGSRPVVITRDDAVGKLRAAAAASGDGGPVVVARLNVTAVPSPVELLDRASAYSKTGAEALFLSGVTQIDQLVALRSVTGLPIIVGSATGELSDLSELARNGVRIGLRGHLPIRAAIQSVYDTMLALRNGDTKLPPLVDENLLKRLISE